MKRISAKELGQNVFRLPRLPIPTIAATADRYRSSTRALWTPEVATTHLTKLDKFLESSAPVLQKHIVDTDKAAAAAGVAPFSYVEALLEQSALGSRTPLEVNMNSGFVLQSGLPGTDNTQSGVASAFVYGVACWIHEVRTTGLALPVAAPVATSTASGGSAGVAASTSMPYDVSPLLTEFGRSLIPSKTTDVLHTTPLERLRHVIVLHDGHPYLVRVFDEAGNVLDRALIQKAFEFVLSITPDQDNTSPVSVLTAGSRAVWGQAYEELIKTPENAEVLRLFHESIIVVCLDSNAWGDDGSLAEASALHGSKEELENRWYDKHQLIVSADGRCALNFEATASDRVHWATWIGEVLAIMSRQGGSGLSTDHVDGTKLNGIVKHLSITYGKSFVPHIRNARKEALSLVSDTAVYSIHLPYGRTQLSALKVDAEAFVQMCAQLAVYKLRNRLHPSSGLCSTAGFFHGTTEILRSVTAEMQSLASTVAQYEAAGTSAAAMDSNAREKVANLIYAASSRHVSLASEASNGEGIDRHLMALHNIARINGDKAALAFFDDELYLKSSAFVLNTSEFSRPWLRYYSFGPSDVNGYGLGCVIDATEVRLSLSAFPDSPATNVSELKASMLWAADTLYTVLAPKA